jgi:hypothetical protein
MFYEGVQHRLRIRLDQLSCVKTMNFQLYLQSEKQRKVGWVGTTVMLFLDKTFLGKKGSVRRCVVVTQQPVLLSPKFGAKSSHIFTQSPSNVTVVYEIDCLVCQDEFFVNNLFDVKENYANSLDFALHLSRHFRSQCV